MIDQVVDFCLLVFRFATSNIRSVSSTLRTFVLELIHGTHECVSSCKTGCNGLSRLSEFIGLMVL